MKNMKVRTKLNLILVLVILLVAFGGTVSVKDMEDVKDKALETMEASSRQSYDDSIKEQVEVVISLLSEINDAYKAGTYTLDEAKKIAADEVRQMRYGEAGYFWIDQSDGTNVVLLGSDTEGTNRMETKDAKGYQMVKEIIRVAVEDGGGYTDFVFPKPGETKPSPKRSYSEYFEPFDWVVGTGNYTDYIDTAIAKQNKVFSNYAMQKAIALIAVCIVMLAVVAVLVFMIAQDITKSLKKVVAEIEVIKENARSIQNVVASLSDQYGSFEDSFKKKVAMSSDDEKVSVTYIGDGSEESKTNNFDIEVQRLATPQINQGRFLKDNTLSMRPGAYSFDLNTSGAAYEFQYNINSDETNLDVLDKLARLVNSSSLGITAEILSDGNGSSALKLTSIQTGLADNETELFSIAPDASTGSTEIMDQLGIDRITSPAQSSAFTLNGTSHSSLTNTFSINQVFELTLHQPTDGEKVNIGFKTDADAIADNIQSLVDAYNSILSTAAVYADTNASAGNKLQTEILSISGSSRSSLQDIGLVTNENGSISIDKEALREAVVPERDQNTFETLSQFRDSIGKEAENISINPMNYVNKIVVAYKNPGHNFATPYITSIYSGMMLDKYV